MATLTSREYSNLKNRLTFEQTVERIHKILDTIPMTFVSRLDKDGGWMSIARVRWEAGWATEASLDINYSTEQHTTQDGEQVVTAKVECEVSWSSTGRSVTNAAAALQTYQMAVNLGTMIESIAREEVIHAKNTARANKTFEAKK